MIFWTPGEYEWHRSRLARFLELAKITTGYALTDYASLHAWSVEKMESFWSLWLKESQIIHHGPSEPVFVPNKSGEFFGGAWFPDVTLNFAENLLAQLPDTALVGCDELGRKRVFSRDDVLSQVRGLQLFLKSNGVGPGDTVAALLPNAPETVIAMLATTSLGAVWSSCSPDFGVQGVLDRFTQVKPKALFVADGYAYAGKKITLAEKNAAVLTQLPNVKATVTLGFMNPEAGDFSRRAKSDGKPPEFAHVPFSAPLYIMFSSGTTGQPKCILHGVGGTLLQHTKEHALHADLKAFEKILYYTTCGWMMWNWLVSALAQGSTVYCYDGSPAHPHMDSLWELVDRERIDVFGTSAKFIASNRSQGLEPRKKFSFDRLRLVLSTGSPLLPEDFDYFYASVCPEKPIPLASISGGTDILSCFMLGCPVKPVERGEIQCLGLGLDVHAFNAAGESVLEEKGELVCVKPFPAMPIGFLNDPDSEKFRKAYFARFPGVWHHGDYVTIRESGGVIIHGRSDATLNPGGVRLGTAEIYRQVETHDAIQDSIVVGQRWEGDERVVLFVQLKEPSAKLSDVISKELRDRIRAGASPRHVPAKIIQVTEIPYTVSGKKVELAVRALINGETPTNVEALANPKSLALYKNLPELKT